ncbi:unnamed protein product [Sphagnum troendelagicum]|uniref:GTP diphosphokinase n=1 Tax=Sphagnum troendelagicum TaxID=128251 RepID=A0ABP0UJJ3_9BRYO
MVLYSSSPPASWPAAAQCAVSGKTSSSSVAAAVVSTVGDVDLLLRTPQQTQASSSVPVKGGLTSLFANAGTKHAQNFSASLSDGYEVGMVRSHSQPELSHSMLLPWEGSESFSGGGGINIPISSSLRSRERSPVSVLQGPVSRSFSVGSPIHSLNARDSASSNGLPPLDPHSDRASRRRSSLTLDTRWPLSRSVGFEVGSEGVFHKSLLEAVQAQHKVFLEPCVIKAFRLAEDAHKGQFRRNGDPYLIHCVETAVILAATGAGSEVVAAGLLHDAVDDSNLSQQFLRYALGDDIADLVTGVSRLSELSQLARDNQTISDAVEVNRLRTMILSMVDVRVVLIKLADRLHNMRTLEALPVGKQLRIAGETLEVFAPLANRLGIWSWKAELEDLCFKYLKPDEYKQLATKLSDCCREEPVMSYIHQLDEALRSQGVQITDLCGRPKNLYSIFKKMTKKGRSFEEIYDVRGLRLVVADEKSCYDALHVVHQLWLHVPGKFKDYVVEPKANGYQSLHTVVWGDDGYPLEVQIRTREMHRQAEFGLAAHWRYKEGDCKHSSFILQRVEWARWVLTWHSEILDTKLRMAPSITDLRPPCPFPVHNSNCPYIDLSSGPPMNKNDPLFIIKVEDENMIVQELAPGSTVGDVITPRKSDSDSLVAFKSRTSRQGLRVKVNHQFVDDLQQTLRMGDLVEVTKPNSSYLPSTQLPGGKIALEFQREQIRRRYLDGGGGTDERISNPTGKKPSVAGLL